MPPCQCISQEGDGKVSEKDNRKNDADALEERNREANETHHASQQMNDRKKVNPPAMSLQLLPLFRS